MDLVLDEVLLDFLKSKPYVKSVYSEESGITDLRSTGYTIVLDPLDGTTNFRMGLSYYAMSMAVLDEELNVVGGIVANLASGACFSAIKGHGAWQDGHRLSASRPRRVSDVNAIFVGLSTDVCELAALAEMARRLKSFRAMGCSALDICCLAAGGCGLFVDLSNTVKLVDILAAALIAEEAGAIVVNLQDTPVTQLPSLASNLSDAVYQHSFRVLGASTTALHDFGRKQCGRLA